MIIPSHTIYHGLAHNAKFWRDILIYKSTKDTFFIAYIVQYFILCKQKWM